MNDFVRPWIHDLDLTDREPRRPWMVMTLIEILLSEPMFSSARRRMASASGAWATAAAWAAAPAQRAAIIKI